MTTQEKIWAVAKNIVYSIRPLLLYLAVPGFCMAIGMTVRRYTGGTAEFSRDSGNFYTLVSLILVMAILWRRAEQRNSSIFKETTLIIKGQDWRFAVLCLLLGACMGLFLSALLTLIPLPAGLMESYKSSSSAMFQQNDLILVVLSVSFLAPVLEEIIFRGYMLNRLLLHFDEKRAVYISSIFFAMCHVNLLWMIYSFFMGVFLARLSLKKDNILYSCFVHMGFNMPSAVIACIQMANGGKQLFFGNSVMIFFYGLIGAVLCRLIWLEMVKGENKL